MMNVRQMIMRVFNGNVSPVEVDSVRASGAEDGRVAAAAYCDGFFDGAATELESRFSGFQMIDVQAIEPDRTRRLPTRERRVLTTKATK